MEDIKKCCREYCEDNGIVTVVMKLYEFNYILYLCRDCTSDLIWDNNRSRVDHSIMNIISTSDNYNDLFNT